MEESVHFRTSASVASPPEQSHTQVSLVVNVLVCNICLAPPTDPVVTVCGHLFCWPCLHSWLHHRPPTPKTCPLCRTELREDISITPVYATASTTETEKSAGASNSSAVIPADTTTTIPKRPEPPLGSRLESLENVNDSRPDSSRFVLRSAAVEEVEAWREECERLQTLLRVYRGRVHALERQVLCSRRDRITGRREHEERGSRSE